MKLGEVATVRSGLVLSRKSARHTDGIPYPLLNLRSIHEKGHIETSQLDQFHAVEPLNSDYLTHAGDIVIRLTIPYTAVLIDDDSEGMVVSSNFVIIRPDTKKILPEYLFWLLNTPKVRRKIYENTTGNMLSAINAKYYTQYDLHLLPIAQQRQIAELNLLSKRETELLRRLADVREHYYNLLTEQIDSQNKRGADK